MSSRSCHSITAKLGGRGMTLLIFDEAGESFQVELTYEQLAAMKCPSSENSFFLYHWLKEFFDLVGDHMPNQNEIHLDNSTVKLQVCV
jgi:hypothetical protein